MQNFHTMGRNTQFGPGGEHSGRFFFITSSEERLELRFLQQRLAHPLLNSHFPMARTVIHNQKNRHKLTPANSNSDRTMKKSLIISTPCGILPCPPITFRVKVKSESENHSVVSNSLQSHGLHSPWNSPGQNAGVGSLFLLQGIFPTQGSNPGLWHCRWILYQLSRKGSPIIKSSSLITVIMDAIVFSKICVLKL